MFSFLSVKSYSYISIIFCLELFKYKGDKKDILGHLKRKEKKGLQSCN